MVLDVACQTHMSRGNNNVNLKKYDQKQKRGIENILYSKCYSNKNESHTSGIHNYTLSTLILQ